MKFPGRAPLHLVVSAALITMSHNYAEGSAETTFSNIVNKGRLRVCAGSAIPTCNNDFDRPTLFAEWLDAEEERAVAIEKAGDEKAAQEVRIQILSYEAMLDIWMEQIRLSHRKDGQPSTIAVVPHPFNKHD
jgi:hypothetical protein